MKRNVSWAAVMLAGLGAAGAWGDESPVQTKDDGNAAQTAPEAAPARPLRQIGTLGWHTDYYDAYREARADKKMLLIFFKDVERPIVAERFEREILADEELAAALGAMTRAVLPLDAALVGDDASRPKAHPDMMEELEEPADRAPAEPPKRLIDHPAFFHLYKQQGLAIIDLTDGSDELYGQVVSLFPFDEGKSLGRPAMQAILDLPRGTLTQRTLIFALKTHPEKPASVRGKCNKVLLQQCHKHCKLMARYEAVGHHDWGSRSAAIGQALGHSPSEVASMSLGSRKLLDAARECVDVWRASGVHWNMISSQQSLFGYDMVRSASGHYYATGIFVR